MMSDAWPSEGERDGAEALLASARARLAAAAADLALPASNRLTEWQRRTVTGLLADLLRRIEEALRARLAGAFADPAVAAALGSAHLPIAEPILAADARLLDPALTAALLRRAEEHRLGAAGDQALLGELAGDSDETVAAEAMSLLILETGRIDRFGDPTIGRSDLPAEIQHRLAWRVAAALRLYLVRQHRIPTGDADCAVAGAVAAFLSGYDEGGGAEAAALRLARRLDELGRLDDAILARLLPEAGLAVLVAGLAVRSGLAAADAASLLADRSGAVLLLRAAGCRRETAAGLLLRLDPADSTLPERLDAFDSVSAGQAAGELVAWRADPAYRSAIVELAR